MFLMYLVYDFHNKYKTNDHNFTTQTFIKVCAKSIRAVSEK